MTAVQTPAQSGVLMKSDDIALDTSATPWMKFAQAELGKKIHELSSNDSFIASMRAALAIDAQVRKMGQDLSELGADSLLLGSRKSKGPSLFQKTLPNSGHQALGRMEASQLKELNPEIAKYFSGLKSDPSYDNKGRSFDIAPTFEAGGRGNITAWCAAFVNWCLSQADAPHLGYATAKSWLGFGTPISHPVYGCITITKPSSSTGSTTGHVAFFVEYRGNKVVLLGGNQRDAVSESAYSENSVLGYRWPTKMNHYLLAGRSAMA